MKILFDARALDLYPVGKSGFSGGTEHMVRKLAHGLAANHTVHVVCPDLEVEEQRGPNEWWWGPVVYPRAVDVYVAIHSMDMLPTAGVTAPLVVVATNAIDPPLLEQAAEIVDAWPVFTEVHKRLLCANREAVDPDKCFVTGLGVDLPRRSPMTVRGRLLYANDPQRGLWHMLNIFDALRALRPYATLHVGYDFDRQFEAHRWQAAAMAEQMWECKRRLEETPGVVKLGNLSRLQLLEEQLECQIHAMPSDPPNVGSQLHGLTQMECAAVGAALVLSDTEAFPELFADAATILPVPGAFVPSAERRTDAQDWAEVIAELMGDSEKWADASQRARSLAAQHTWEQVVVRWEDMLATLAGEPVRDQSSGVPEPVAV